MRESQLYETKHWIIILTDDQYNLGRCYIKCKRVCPSLGELTNEESQDLHEHVVTKLENAIKKAFGAKYFNWECLMNNDYKGEGRTPHVRLHFRPRYNKKVTVANETFEDKECGEKYILQKEKHVSDETFNAIKEAIGTYIT